MSLIENERLQGLSTLELAKDIVEQGPQLPRFHGVEDLSHVRVRGNMGDPKQIPHVLVIAAFLKCQQRGVLQRKHAESRHQCVRQGNRTLPPTMVGDLLKPNTPI